MNPRILFIGGTLRGLELLETLIKRGEKIICAYIMKEDKHESVKVSGNMKKICKKNNIPNMVCKRIAPGEIAQTLELEPDIAFVCGWRTLIPHPLYKKIPLGCLAAHDSLLPKYRGFAPLNWAIINGEERTGVTLFKIMDGVVDSGDIFNQKIVKIRKEDSARDIYPHITRATIQLYVELLSALKRVALKYRKQDERQATYTCKRTPGDGEINWCRPAKEIFNLIRAISPPYPCAWTYHNGKKIYIEKASLPPRQLDYSGNIPGRIVSFLDTGVLVLCGRGQIIINKILDSSGKRISLDSIFRSISSTLGK